MFVTSTTGLTSEQSLQNKQPAVISRSHGLLVSAQSYEAVMAVSSEVLNMVDRQESEQVAGNVRRMVTDSSTSMEDVRFMMASKQSQTDTQLTSQGWFRISIDIVRLPVFQRAFNYCYLIK